MSSHITKLKIFWRDLLLDSSVLGPARVFTFFFLRNSCVIFGSVLWIVIMLEYFSSAKLLETESHLITQFFTISTGIHPTIFKCNFPSTFCTSAASCHHDPISKLSMFRSDYDKSHATNCYRLLFMFLFYCWCHSKRFAPLSAKNLLELDCAGIFLLVILDKWEYSKVSI